MPGPAWLPPMWQYQWLLHFAAKNLCCSHDLQEDLGIGYDCSIGGNELDCELGLTARAT